MKEQENQQKAFCIIGGESRGIRISSRNSKRIKTAKQQTETMEKSQSGPVLYKIYIILMSNFASFYRTIFET